MERDRAVRWARWALLALAIVGAGVVSTPVRNDFVAFYDAGEAALRHGDVYAQGPRMQMHVFYAPTFSLLLAPFALVDPRSAAWLWYGLQVVALGFLVRWLHRAVRAGAPGAGPRAAAACTGLALLVAFNPLMSELRLGQANLFVLLFTVLTVRALRRGRSLQAAFFFSLAAVKVTPLALLPWLALRRQWRFFLGLLPVGAAWLAALAAWWGPGRVPELFREWIRVTATVKAIPSAVAFFENQSLQGAAARLALAFPALARPLLGVVAWQWLWIVPCAALVGVLALAAARDGFRPRMPPEEFALASLLMLLASSDSRWAHHVQLLVPLGVLVALAARVRLLESLPRIGPWLTRREGTAAVEDELASRRLRLVLAVLLGAGLVILVVLGRDVVGRAANHAVRAWSFHTVFDLALVIFLSARLLRPAGGPAAPVEAAKWL